MSAGFLHELDLPEEAPFHAPLSSTISPPMEVHAPHGAICLCLPGHLGNTQEKKWSHTPELCSTGADTILNPPKDQPCPLAESVAKLRREVGFYFPLWP